MTQCTFFITFNSQIQKGSKWYIPTFIALKYLFFCQHASQRALCTGRSGIDPD